MNLWWPVKASGKRTVRKSFRWLHRFPSRCSSKVPFGVQKKAFLIFLAAVPVTLPSKLVPRWGTGDWVVPDPAPTYLLEHLEGASAVVTLAEHIWGLLVNKMA